MSVPGVDGVGIRFPAITRKIGNFHILDEAPVVVITRQGLNPIGRKLSDFDGAGFGQLQAGGSPKAAVAVMDAVEERGSEPERSFPIGHVIFAIDISDSMSEPSGLPDGSSKLGHIQETIKTLAKSGIPDDTPLTLIIFDSTSKTVIRHTVKIKDFFAAIAGLRIGMNTNITSAFQEAGINIKAFETNSSDPDRNFFMLVTDGDHNTPSYSTVELFSKAEELSRLNCGGYIVGVGNDYNKNVIQELASRMGYAGWCHTPGDKSGVNVFGKNIPAFLDQMSRMEHYITVLAEGFSGNGDNRRLFTLTPAIIRANYQRTGSDFLQSPHYVVRTGFQREGFSIGFAPDRDLDSDKAKLHLCLQRHASSELKFERKEIPIFRPDELPHYGMFEEREEAKRLRDLLLRAPLDFENFLCQDAEDADAFDDFVQRNPDFMPDDQSVVISENLRKPSRDTASESFSRGSISDASSAFTGQTVSDWGAYRGTVSDANVKKSPGTYDGQSGSLHSNLDSSKPASPSESQPGDSSFNPAQHSGLFLGPPDFPPVDVDSQGNVPPFEAGAVTHYKDAQPIAGGIGNDPISSVGGISASNPSNTIYLCDGNLGFQILSGSINKINVKPDALDSLIVHFGRSPDNEVVLDSAAVSRCHCLVQQRDKGVYHIGDNSSRNGTYVNGKRVQGNERLNDGDRIKICEFLFLVHIKSFKSDLFKKF